MRKIFVSGLVTATAVLGGAGAALAGAGTTGMTATAGPVTASSSTAGSRISCSSPTACLAIGTHDGSAGTGTPFVARLRAGHWKAVPVKVPAGPPSTLLSDVSCKSATYCLAVGEGPAKAGGFGGYAATWNGTALKPVAPPPLPAHTLGFSEAVSCVAVNSCVAIGYAVSATGDATSTVIWTWNGGRWTTTVVPGPANIVPQYASLRCFSLTSCVAVGHLDVAISSAGSSTPMAVAWNGTSLTSLNPGLNIGVSNGQFNALSCVSPHSCAAVGTGARPMDNTGGMAAFAEVWNGKTWAVTKWSGPKGDTNAELLGVSCTSAVRCIAVGMHGTAKTAAPAALAWTGSKWTVLKVAGPGAGKAAYFAGISCPVNGKCLTTGATGKAGGSAATPIAGDWNGRSWKYGPMFTAA